jgi:NAD(P)-dependent dehydrogenase (short-subunit alcohol dehydrogenase family)
MKELRGKTAIVTGAASGIGLAITRAMVAEGMNVAMADLDFGRAAEAATLLGEATLPIAVDVSDPESVEAAAQATVEHFGGINVAVNNAGITNGGLSWELSLDDWRNVLNVNLWGVIHGIRSFVPRILTSGHEGHVVNTGSIASVLPFFGSGPYSASKHAVLAVSDVLRAELADTEVGVSVVLPGMTHTGMTPHGEDPSVVAINVMAGIRHDRPYIYTDGFMTAEVNSRLQALQDARGYVAP